MTWPQTIPQLRGHIKGSAAAQRATLTKMGKDLAEGTVRPSFAAEEIAFAAANLEMEDRFLEWYTRVNAGPNTDPLHRLRMLKAFVQDYLFGEVGVHRGGFGRAYSDHQMAWCKTTIRMLDAMITMQERKE